MRFLGFYILFIYILIIIEFVYSVPIPNSASNAKDAVLDKVDGLANKAKSKLPNLNKAGFTTAVDIPGRDNERGAFLDADKQVELNRLDNVLTRKKQDPSLGFPVVEPKEGENKKIRHILIYNRMSPPNSLKIGDISDKMEFYAWINHSPGRDNKVTMRIQGKKNVLFPEAVLKKKYSRPSTGIYDYDELHDSMTIEWNGLLSVRNMRKDIPIIISNKAKTKDICEIYINKADVKYTSSGSLTGFKYEAFANPKTLRWKVGPPIQFNININNGKRITGLVPDGLYRKFKLRYNQPIKKGEFIIFYMAPFIEDLESNPLKYYSNVELKFKKKSLYSASKRFWRGKYKFLNKQRIRKNSPFFNYEQFWPTVLCDKLQVITASKDTIYRIARAITPIKKKWFGIGIGAVTKFASQVTSVFDGSSLKKKLRKDIKKIICSPMSDSFCEEIGNTKCGRWSKKYYILWDYDSTTFSPFSSGIKKTIKFRVHPDTPISTPVTWIFGFDTGIINDDNKPEINPRFYDNEKDQPNRYYLPNQFSYVRESTGDKKIRIRCKQSTQINDKHCCTLILPIKNFVKGRPEKEFDLLVYSANENIEFAGDDNVISQFFTWKNSYRVQFRKSLIRGPGIRTNREKFCYRAKAYGSYVLEYQIMKPCGILNGIDCDSRSDLGKNVKQSHLFRDENILPPKDFKVPLPITIVCRREPLKWVFVKVEGTGEGNSVVGVKNHNWFEIAIIFVGFFDGPVSIQPVGNDFEFEPEILKWDRYHPPFGKLKAKPNIDCPNPNRLKIINFNMDDSLLTWEHPSPLYLQIQPDPKEQTEDIQETIICKDVDEEEECTNGETLCAAPADAALEIKCDLDPESCEEPVVQKEESNFRRYVIYILIAFIGLFLFTILYRNCFGADGNAFGMLALAMKDINAGQNYTLPKDAISANEFLKLAGLDSDTVFDLKNPDPIKIAEAELAAQQILELMRK